MYDKNDPRAALNATTQAVNLHSTFSPADYLRFYGTAPQDASATVRTWYGRGQNFLLAYSEAEEGAELNRVAQPDEYAILLPRHEARIEVSAGGHHEIVDGYHLIFVPPGDSRVRVLKGGPVVRIFTTRAL